MNIAELIREQARRHPKRTAVAMARAKNGGYVYPCYTFQDFERRSNLIAARLRRSGVEAQERVVLFIRPSLDFSVIVFALFKLGAIPVLIDPGMGRKNLLKAVEEVAPSGLIGVNVVHLLRRVFRRSFKSVRWHWSVEKNWWLAPELLAELSTEEALSDLYPARDDEPAAILFTSGGTGTPKGVVTTHGILASQTRMLQAMFQLDAQQVDLPGFPLFALFTLAMGMTSVIPDMDPTRPAACDPAKITRNLLDKDVTFAAGSPAIWERVGRHCAENKIVLPKLKHVVMFGAPVRGEIHQLWAPLLPNGTTHAPYGATEVLPVASMSGQEVLRDTWGETLQGKGACVGVASPGNEIFIIEDTDIPERCIQPLSRGEIGEIVVRGPTVTPGYYQRSEATALAKIVTDEGLAHRMGDVGWMDERGRVWFCGRKAHVVRAGGVTYYPIPVEAIFNQHPAVKRSALIDLGGKAAVALELKTGHVWGPSLEAELRTRALAHDHTRGLSDFLVHDGFPVDVRHNIKIDRLALSRWAQQEKRA